MKKKLFTLLTLFVLCVTGVSATDYSFNCYNHSGYFSTSSGTVTSQKDDNDLTDIQLVFAKVGSNSENGCSGNAETGYIKLCKGNTLTISSENKTFVSVIFNFNSKDYGPAKSGTWSNNFTANKGTLKKISDTQFMWEGDATSSVVLTHESAASYDFRFRTISVSTVLKTGVKVNAEEKDASYIAYSSNAEGISGSGVNEVTFTGLGTFTGTNMQGPGSNLTVSGKAYSSIKGAKGSTYVLTPIPGVEITAVKMYTTSNNSSNLVDITTGGVTYNVTKTNSSDDRATPQEIDLVKNASGYFEFTVANSSAHSQNLFVLVATYNKVENVDVSISSAGYATLYYGEKNLAIPAGITAYSATVSGSNIVLTEVDDVIPADKGVILKGDPGTYNFIVTAAAAPSISENILTGTTTPTTKAALGGTVYTLGQNGEGVVGLRSYTGTDIRAYSAYSTSISLARDFYAFDEDVTAINKVETKKVENNVFFNLAGQQVAQPTKGLYIVNGKKVIIK